MKAPGAALQGGLAALGLVAAYTTWQREPERKAGEAVIVDASQSDVQKIRFEDGNTTPPKWVELERRKESEGPRVWMRVSARPEQKQPERELRGNDSANKLWEKFAPLKATRALGQLPLEKLKEVGLDAPKKRLEITTRGQKQMFFIGASPFGVSDPYVRSESDGKVFVLGGGIVGDLDAAAIRLVDRQLHDWKTSDYDELKVTANGKSRELTQTSAEQPTQAKLADKTGKVNEQAKNWHDRLWRSLVSDVLGKGETPAGGEPVLALRVDYKSHGKEKGFMELGRVQAKAPEPAASTTPVAAAPTIEVYARTEATAGWVKLGSNIDDLIKEADKVVSAE